MTDARLKQTERSLVFHLVSEVGFDPTEFTWDEKRDHESFRSNMGGGDQVAVSVLRHRPTEYYMRFGAFANEFSPGISTRVDYDNHDGTWKTRVRSCVNWLRELRKEVDVPDLWGTIANEKALPMAASAIIDNRLFTPAEHNLILAKLDEIKAYLRDGQDFTTEQAKVVEREFAYLRESSERLGRKDWLNSLLGGVVGMAIGLALDPQKARGLLGLAGSAFQSLWNVAHTLLP